MIQESALFYDRIVPYCKFQDFFVEYIYGGKNEKFHIKYELKLYVLEKQIIGIPLFCPLQQIMIAPAEISEFFFLSL